MWVVLGLVAAAVLGVGFGYWWWQRNRRSEMISFVGLLREPVSWDTAVLARVASRAWQADLGDGSSEGEDGFVASNDISHFAMCRGRLVMINSFPSPYFENVQEVADSISDLRVRSLVCEHTAWFSCDAMHLRRRLASADKLEWYRLLGRLFAELLDDNCLLLYVPETGLTLPINEDTEQALRAANPLEALQETATLPLVEVDPDDPLLQKAVAEARARWPEFVSAYEQGAGEAFSVKAPVTVADNTEYIWLSVTAIEGDRIYGTLDNDPGNLGRLKRGSKVSVAVADLADWMYISTKKRLVGGFTLAAVSKAWRRKRS